MYSRWLVVATKANNENKVENLKRQNLMFFPRIKKNHTKKILKMKR